MLAFEMRIIAGPYKSRQLKAPPGLKTRPTSDRLRETIFNVLAPRIAGARFLDLYAGSGAVALEALSRGAAEITCVESAPSAVKIIHANLQSLGIAPGAGFRIENALVAGFLRKIADTGRNFDLIFFDPPYDAAVEYQTTLGALPPIMHTDALAIAEHRKKDNLADEYGPLKRIRLLAQGDAALSFYRLQ